MSNPRRTLDSVEAARLQLLNNGYSPIHNRDKRCFMSNWPRASITPEEIHKWSRRHKRDTATGIRVENGLAVIDIDVDDAELFNKIAQALEDAVPEVLDGLVRRGKGTKEAWFVRTEEMFSRIHTRRWRHEGADPDADTFCVEIFGGAAARQFGALGPHTVDDEGSTLIEYTWDGPSPLEVPLGELPGLPKDAFYRMADIAEDIMKRAGLEPVPMSTKGENDACKVYDLTEDMSFACNDGMERSLAALREAVGGGDGHLRCSASFIEGAQAKRTDRCLVSLDRSGGVSIWESASGVTHCEAENEPEAQEPDLERFAELMKAIDRGAEKKAEQDARKLNRLDPKDNPHTTAKKLLNTYAFCPTRRNNVVELWATSLDNGMTLPNFKTDMTPYVKELPQGNKLVKVHPVGLWVADERRLSVAGLRMRPDKPRPTYEEDGKTWINIYNPPVHDKEGGSLDTGLEFMEQLLPDERERAWFMQWLAFKFLHPHIPGPAILMVAKGAFGTGRGTMGRLMAELFGRRYTKTVPFSIFAGKSYQSQYTDWAAEAVMVLVNEASEAAGGSPFTAKRDTYEHLKDLIDPAPVERLFIPKGEKAFSAVSAASYMVMTNHMDALPIPANDRRFAVLSNGEPREEEFWIRINAWIDDPANVAAFARHLRSLDLTGYSPFAPPLKTEAKAAMADAGKSDLDHALDMVLTNMPSDVMVIEQVVAGMAQASSLYDFDFPMNWRTVAKRMAQRALYRVGVRDGMNWHPQIEGKRYAIYAKTQKAARYYTMRDPDEVRRDVLRNGSPAATGLPGNVLVGLFNKRSETDDA